MGGLTAGGRGAACSQQTHARATHRPESRRAPGGGAAVTGGPPWGGGAGASGSRGWGRCTVALGPPFGRATREGSWGPVAGSLASCDQGLGARSPRCPLAERARWPPSLPAPAGAPASGDGGLSPVTVLNGPAGERRQRGLSIHGERPLPGDLVWQPSGRTRGAVVRWQCCDPAPSHQPRVLVCRGRGGRGPRVSPSPGPRAWRLGGEPSGSGVAGECQPAGCPALPPSPVALTWGDSSQWPPH